MSASQICESRRPRSMLQFLVPGTASPMVTAPVDPIAAGRWRGGLAAEMEPGAGREATGSPVAGAVSPVAATASPAAGVASLAAGAGATASPGPRVASLVAYGCCAWPLSLDATCEAVAPAPAANEA